jgi:UDP-glucose 4-epimerase
MVGEREQEPGPILITGAAGFVGAHLVEHFARAGNQVIAADRRRPDAALGETAGVRWVTSDLADASFAEQLPPRLEGVIHAAGTSRSAIATSRPVECVRETVLGTARLLETVSGRVRWFLLLSSRMVSDLEGRAGVGGGKADVYAVAKQASENLLRCYGQAHGIAHLAARLSDVYGSPRDHADKLLPTLLRRAREGKPLLLQDPEARFYFVHIEDLVGALADAVADLRGGASWEVRELWSRPGIAMTALAELVKRVAGSTSEIVNVFPTRLPPADEPPPWGPPRLTARVSLEEGIGRLLR